MHILPQAVDYFHQYYALIMWAMTVITLMVTVAAFKLGIGEGVFQTLVCCFSAMLQLNTLALFLAPYERHLAARSQGEDSMFLAGVLLLIGWGAYAYYRLEKSLPKQDRSES